MGYDFYLFDEPIQIVGTEYVSDPEFFELIKHENGLFYYRPKDNITNLDRKIEELAYELKNIEPIDDIKLIYCHEYLENNYIIEGKSNNVRVYSGEVEIVRGRKILEV